MLVPSTVASSMLALPRSAWKNLSAWSRGGTRKSSSTRSLTPDMISTQDFSLVFLVGLGSRW